MLTIKNRIMATAALLSIAVVAPTAFLVPPAEAAVVTKQSVSDDNLIAHHDDYEYNQRHSRQINFGRHRRHRHNQGNYQYNNGQYNNGRVIYQSPQPRIIYTQPQVIYQPQVVTVPHGRRCVTTLYSTICN
jgi:hypothetical protein